MTFAITHAFVSAKGDGTDATLVRPSNWNAVHATSMANNNIIGNVSGLTGPAVEIPATAYALACLAGTDANSFLAALGIGGFTTGDCKHSINPTAATGWLVYQGQGTIGDPTSTATVRANADCSTLFQMIWNQISDTYCPVLGGRGANALADFNAHKQITLPWFSGRTVIGAGGGGALTNRAVGLYLGEEAHTQLVAEIGAHFHSAGISDPGHTHSGSCSGSTNASSTGGGAFPTGYSGSVALSINAAATGVLVNGGPNGNNTTYTAGSSTPFNVMQPSVALWTHLKL